MSVRIESQSEPIPGYRLLDRLGSGGFGEVWRAEAPGGIYKAVKIIFGDLRSQDKDLVCYAAQELKSLKRVKQVRHPYLLALDRFDIVEGRLMIVMELADCNLWDRFRECRNRGLPGIPREELLLYMAETAEVLDLMNDQFGLQHLDIKPQNLFLLYNHVKVADFGQVKDLQGVMANVTGGITPVYAAPETFDGLVSRYCDQYSLACVYQELLTGLRPFGGTSVNQLLMQHIQLPPDLNPSPPYERPILKRALAKKPEERWPNVSTFVRALREARESCEPASLGSEIAGSSETHEVRAETHHRTEFLGVAEEVSSPESASPNRGIASLTLETPRRRSTDETDNFELLVTPVPPELSGPGSLRPALVIGIGQSGLRVLQRLRFDLTERYGPPEAIPLIRTLYIDTDADGLEEASHSRPQERLAALGPDEICPANLNRAGHYLKPRLNGRNIMEGWFDQQVLYRIPRTPHTTGIRQLGRLAFCDHHRTLVNRIHSELELTLAPDSLHLTEVQTGLERHTNRPRVYVVAGLAGGTGSGMFLDVAYNVRAKLRRMGFSHQEIVGIFLVPPFEAALNFPLALGNTFAALTELHHYSLGDTRFTAHYEDRYGALNESGSPFTRFYVVPGPDGSLQPARATPAGSGVVRSPRASTPPSIPPPGSRPRMPGLRSGTVLNPGSRVVPAAATTRKQDQSFSAKSYVDAAALIRLQLFSPVGRVADEVRERSLAEEDSTGTRFSTFGVASFEWPREEVVNHATRAVSRALLKQWLAPNPLRAREQVPGWAADRWAALGLAPEALLARLQAAAEHALGSPLEELIDARQLATRGWLGRQPDPEKFCHAIDRLVRLVGPPSVLGKRGATAVEDAVAHAADVATRGFSHDLRSLGQSLVDDPELRPAIAEETLRQLHATTERLMDQYSQYSSAAAEDALHRFEILAQLIHYRKGAKKQAFADISDAIQGYPRSRVQAMTFHYLFQLYRSLRDIFIAQLDEVVACRHQLEQAGAVEPSLHAGSPGSRRLMPPGCPSVAEAIQRFLDALTGEDQATIDRRVHGVIEAELGGMFHSCLASSAGAERVVSILREETRRYLNNRLGDVDLGAMFAQRFSTRSMAEAALSQAYGDAEPGAVGRGPWETASVTVLAAPPGPTGDAIRELAQSAIPVAGLPITDSRDEIIFYREYPAVPLTALPHLGPEGAAAYRDVAESNQCSPHSRLDVLRWEEAE